MSKKKMSKAKITITITPWTAFLTLSILKLIGWVKWSWWTVTSPLWAPILFIILLVFVACLICWLQELIRN